MNVVTLHVATLLISHLTKFQSEVQLCMASMQTHLLYKIVTHCDEGFTLRWRTFSGGSRYNHLAVAVSSKV